MKYFGTVIRLSVAIVIGLQSLVAALASGEREQISVLAARVRWGLSQRPVMPDSPPYLPLQNPTRSESPDRRIAGHNEDHAETFELQRVIEEQSIELAEIEARNKYLNDYNKSLSESLEKAIRELMELKKQQILPPAGDVTGSPPPPGEAVYSAPSPAVCLKLISPVGAAVSVEPYEVTVFTASWCGPCQLVKQRDGSGNRDVRLNWIESKPPHGVPESYPVYCWNDSAGRLRYVSGAKVLAELTAIIDRNDPPARGVANASASAVGGTIQTGGRVRMMLSLWTDRLGPDAEISVKWDRSGSQSLSATRLMHGQVWTATMVAGKVGHLSLGTTSRRLPLGISQIGIGYRLFDDGRAWIDADPLNVALPQLQSSASRSVVGTGTCGFLDPVSLGMDLFDLFSILHQILNPQIDVGLPGTVELTAKLSGPDKLAIQFTECPSIHVSAWWKFDLVVQHVEITPTNIHVAFKPQPGNWIKIESRDFPVKD